MQKSKKYSRISNDNANDSNNNNGKFTIMGGWIVLILITIMIFNVLMRNHE